MTVPQILKHSLLGTFNNTAIIIIIVILQTVSSLKLLAEEKITSPLKGQMYTTKYTTKNPHFCPTGVCTRKSWNPLEGAILISGSSDELQL